MRSMESKMLDFFWEDEDFSLVMRAAKDRIDQRPSDPGSRGEKREEGRFTESESRLAGNDHSARPIVRMWASRRHTDHLSNRACCWKSSGEG